MINIKKIATSAGYNTTTGTDLKAEPDTINLQALSDDLRAYEDLTGEQPAYELIEQHLTAYQWCHTCSHKPGSPVRNGIAWQIGLDTGTYGNTTELLLSRRHRRQLPNVPKVRDWELFGADEYLARRERREEKRRSQGNTQPGGFYDSWTPRDQLERFGFVEPVTSELLGAVTAHDTGNAVNFWQRSDTPAVVYVQTTTQEKEGVAVPLDGEDLYWLAEVITEILADQGEGEMS